jgi:hypothetical protein
LVDARQWTIDLLKTPSARDKQKTIGPSAIGDPCSYCVAEHLIRSQNTHDEDPKPGRYWLGARIGTAIHKAMEEETIALGDPDIVPERKITVGELPGYGIIDGSGDTTFVLDEQIVDYKTTKRDKLRLIKLAFTTEKDDLDTDSLMEIRHKVQGYIGQIMLYGKGLNAMGTPISLCTFVFICRDGTGDSDIWAVDLTYDPVYAEKVWSRLEAIWSAVQGGRELKTFPKHEWCYACNHRREND